MAMATCYSNYDLSGSQAVSHQQQIHHITHQSTRLSTITQQQQQPPQKDYSIPLHVDCSVEYELPNQAKPPAGTRVEPLLMIHPCYFRKMESQRRSPFINNMPNSSSSSSSSRNSSNTTNGVHASTSNTNLSTNSNSSTSSSSSAVRRSTRNSQQTIVSQHRQSQHQQQQQQQQQHLHQQLAQQIQQQQLTQMSQQAQYPSVASGQQQIHHQQTQTSSVNNNNSNNNSNISNNQYSIEQNRHAVLHNHNINHNQQQQQQHQQQHSHSHQLQQQQQQQHHQHQQNHTPQQQQQQQQTQQQQRSSWGQMSTAAVVTSMNGVAGVGISGAVTMTGQSMYSKPVNKRDPILSGGCGVYSGTLEGGSLASSGRWETDRSPMAAIPRDYQAGPEATQINPALITSTSTLRDDKHISSKHKYNLRQHRLHPYMMTGSVSSFPQLTTTTFPQMQQVSCYNV